MTAPSPKKTAPSRRLLHLRELDGVRGLAAFLVFVHHLCFTDLNLSQWGRGVQMLGAVAAQGMRGVDLFFVLSGFLITSLLIQDRSSTSYYQDFYWKRTLRILPLYFLCLLGVALFIPHSGGEVLLSALFIANFAQMFHVVSTGPFWTLAIEEQFYLLWPTVVRRRSIEELSRWALAIGGGAILLRIVFAWYGHFNYTFTFLRCDGLAAGALLACWFERREETHAQRRRESRYMLAGGTLGLLCLVLRLWMTPTLRGQAFSAALLQTGVMLLATSAVAAIIAHRGAAMLAVFRSRILLFFGLISYAFYMIHLYVLHAYIALRGPVPAGDTVALAVRFGVVLAITVALCLVSRYAVELPANALRRFVLKRPAPPAEIETPLLAG